MNQLKEGPTETVQNEKSMRWISRIHISSRWRRISVTNNVSCSPVHAKCSIHFYICLLVRRSIIIKWNCSIARHLEAHDDVQPPQSIGKANYFTSFGDVIRIWN
jgi:hypothetical protein